MKAIRLVLSHTSTDSTLVSIIRISVPVNSPVIVPCALGCMDYKAISHVSVPGY